MAISAYSWRSTSLRLVSGGNKSSIDVEVSLLPLSSCCCSGQRTRRIRAAVARSDRGSTAAARGPRRTPGGDVALAAGVPALEIGVAADEGAIEVVLLVEMVLDAATDSELRLDVGGAFDTRGVGTPGGAVAPVVMTLSYYAIYIMESQVFLNAQQVYVTCGWSCDVGEDGR
jgi:hypothetical protein